jgi:hypothetical protein
MAPTTKKKSKAKSRSNNGRSSHVNDTTTNVTNAATCSSSSKIMQPQKNGAANKQPKKLSLEELILAADHAVSVSHDIRYAVRLYTMALQKLDATTTPPLPTPTTATRTSKRTNAANPINIRPEDEVVLQQQQQQQCRIDIYEKRADVYIQLNQSDNAVQDYRNALQYFCCCWW